MEDTKKTCANCKRLIKNDKQIDDPYSNYMCIDGGWTGVESVLDLGEPVDCEHFEEIER